MASNRKTGHILSMIKQLQANNDNPLDELYERTTRLDRDKVYFKPIPPESGYNRKLLNASKKISLKYTPLKGRHLVATEKVSYGEVLIVEPALIATDKPNSERVRMNSYRCHHCTASISYFVVCRWCDLCIFCNYECREISWYEYHRWECYGLQRRFWFPHHPQYMAMRMMFYGAQNGFDFDGKEFQDDLNGDTQNYGDPKNPYKYLYKLPCPLRKQSLEKLCCILLKCSEILVYLIEDTDFFQSLCQFPEYASMRLYDLYMFVGGILVHHYVQAETNTIYMLKYDDHETVYSDRIDFKAGAIFVLAPFLANSCDPNVMWTFRDNEIVVKALTTIKPGTQLTVLWKAEHENKNCLCDHCCSAITAKYMYNAFKCSNCCGSVTSEEIAQHATIHTPFSRSDLFDSYPPEKTLKCVDCGEEHHLEEYKTHEKQARKNLWLYKRTGELEYLSQGVKEFKLFLMDSHAYLCEINDLLINYYVNENIVVSFQYIQSNLTILETHWGKHSYRLLVKKADYLAMVIGRLKSFSEQTHYVAQFCLLLYEEIQFTAKLYCTDQRLVFDASVLEALFDIVKQKKLKVVARAKTD